jgi:hypothetical protein
LEEAATAKGIGAHLGMDKAEAGEQVDSGIGRKGVELKIEASARSQDFEGIAGDSAVEEQGVCIGHEEGLVGLVVKDVGGHRFALMLTDIGRVTYY